MSLRPIDSNHEIMNAPIMNASLSRNIRPFAAIDRIAAREQSPQSCFTVFAEIWNWIKENLLCCFFTHSRENTTPSTTSETTDTTETTTAPILEGICSGTYNQYNFVVREDQNAIVVGASACPYISAIACQRFLQSQLENPGQIDQAVALGIVGLFFKENIIDRIDFDLNDPNVRMIHQNFKDFVDQRDRNGGVEGLNRALENAVNHQDDPNVRMIHQNFKDFVDQRDRNGGVEGLNRALENAVNHQDWNDIAAMMEQIFQLKDGRDWNRFDDMLGLDSVLRQGEERQNYLNSLNVLTQYMHGQRRVAALFTKPPQTFAVLIERDEEGTITHASLFDSHGDPSNGIQGAFLRTFHGADVLEKLSEELVRAAPYIDGMPNQISFIPLTLDV